MLRDNEHLAMHLDELRYQNDLLRFYRGPVFLEPPLPPLVEENSATTDDSDGAIDMELEPGQLSEIGIRQ